jgi:hypothetical protein
MERPEGFRAALQEIDELVAAFERHPDERVRSLVTALLVAVDTVHREGLNRLVRGLQQRGADWMVGQLREDPVVAMLLGLYDLAPLNEAAPVVEEEETA